METNEYTIMADVEDTYWWFVGRRFLLERLLDAVSSAEGHPQSIDIGCGTGSVLNVLTGYGAAYGVDASQTALTACRDRGFDRIARCDVNRSLPFRDNSFQFITCLDVLEHIEHDRRLVREMTRICAPGGMVMVTVPALDALWSMHDEALHHRRRYTLCRLQQLTVGLNCTVALISYFNTMLFLPILCIRKIRDTLRQGAPPKSDFYISIPAGINQLLTVLFKAEMALLSHLRLPFGVSLLMVLQKT